VVPAGIDAPAKLAVLLKSLIIVSISQLSLVAVGSNSVPATVYVPEEFFSRSWLAAHEIVGFSVSKLKVAASLSIIVVNPTTHRNW